MKIKNVGGPKGAAPAKGAKRTAAADGSAFSDQVRAAQGGADEAASAGPVGGTGAVAGVDAILAAQAVGDSTEDEAKRQARSYGDALLDHLDEIRAGLLVGAIPKDRLAALAQAMRARKLATTDPAMLALLDEIELRAEVEIAKFSRTS